MTNATLRKQQLVEESRAAYERWDALLAAKSDAEIETERGTAAWSLKDVVAHLMAWQQLSNARLEAALHDREPDLPAWLGGASPFFPEELLGDFNGRIRDIHRSDPWAAVHRAWRDGFLRFLELTAAMPEDKLFDQRYAWLRGEPLSAVVEGSCGHHNEHFKLAEAKRSVGIE